MRNSDRIAAEKATAEIEILNLLSYEKANAEQDETTRLLKDAYHR